MAIIVMFKAVMTTLLVVGYSSSEKMSAKFPRTRRDLTTPVPVIRSTPLHLSQGKPFSASFNESRLYGRDNFQAGTTVNTIVSQGQGPGGTYSPNQEGHRSQTQSSPVLHGGFKVSTIHSYPQRIVQIPFGNNPQPFAGPQGHQSRNKVVAAGSNNRQHTGAPGSGYRLQQTVPEARQSSVPLSIENTSGFPPFPKFKPSSFNDQSFESLQKFPFGSGSPKFSSPYKDPNHGKNAGEGSYAPDFSPPANLKIIDDLGPSFGEYGPTPGSAYTSKKTSFPANLKSASGKTFDHDPVALAPTFDYQRPSTSGINFDYSSRPTAGVPYTNTNYHQPISTPSALSLHAPAYKSSGSFSNNEPNRLDGYEHVSNQPHFHFSPTNNNPAINYAANSQTPSLYGALPDGDHSFDSDFNTGSQFRNYGGDTVGKLGAAPVSEVKYNLPRTSLFDSYDAAFGKYSKLATIEENTTERRVPKVEPTSKPVYHRVEEVEDDGSSPERASSGEYHSSYTDTDRRPNSSYEEEDEEADEVETDRINERQTSDESSQERDDDEDEDEDESRAYTNYGEDFEREFERSYAKELPKNDYVHVKEVPEIEESRRETKKRPRPSESSSTSRQGIRPVYEEPKKYKKPSYRDSEGYGSRTGTGYRTQQVAEPTSSGHKTSRGANRYTSNDDNSQEDETVEDVSITNEPSTQTSNVQGRSGQYSRSNGVKPRPRTTTVAPVEERRTYPPFKSWTGGKKLSKRHETFRAPARKVRSSLSVSQKGQGPPQGRQQGLRPITSGQMVRDLTGI